MPRERVHFVGIGGIGMCGLARVLVHRGYEVSGSDREGNPLTRRLAEQEGVLLQEGRDPFPITKDIDRIVHTAAVGEEHPELVRARELGIPIEVYARALGREFDLASCPIGVAGTHGKTTTTSIISFLLMKAKLDPSYVIGGEVSQLDGNAFAGGGPHFVAEACEFGRSFHQLSPRIALITNIEADHLDYYRDLEEIDESFATFAHRVGSKGVVICHHSAAQRLASHGPFAARLETYGTDAGADWRAENIRIRGRETRFRLVHHEQSLGMFRLILPGRHNIENALGALVACRYAGVDVESLQNFLPRFVGVRRRFERILDAPDLAVVNDYAHHPTEIKAVLQTAREVFGERRIWCVFQPHQYSRTRCLLDEFGESFGSADRVIIPDIFAARDSEEEKRQVHARDVVATALASGSDAYYVPAFEEILAWFEEILEPGDVVLTLGAGNIDRLSRELVNRHGGMARLEGMQKARAATGRFEVVAG